MPITPFLDGDHFDPETKRVMGVAFEATLASLRLADREDPFAAIIARKIIALAKAGESNPDRLCECILSDVRSAKYQPFRISLDSESRVSVKAKKRPPFNVKTFLATVGGGRTVSNYRKDRKVFSQGDPADSVFYIQEGNVKVCVISGRGKEAVVALHGTGDFFGEGCLTGQPLRLATVAAVTDCVIMRLDKAAILRVLHDEPKFSEAFMSYLLARNARVEEDLVDQLFNSSEKRLARLLLLLANFGKEGKPERVIAKISQETLAEMVGTTRSRVSSFMNKFRKLGFIEYNGVLEVHNSLLNVVLHDNPHLRSMED